MKILVVDDSSINRLIVKEVIKKIDCHIEIDSARSGFDAIVLCANIKYDIIIMDLLMGNIDGISASKEIRRNTICKDSVIVGYTSLLEGEPGYIEAEESNVFNFFINKPVDMKRFKELISDPIFNKG